MKQSIDFKGQKKSEAVGISKHNLRNKKFNISNKNIDKSLSEKNIILQENLVPEISKRVKELARKKLIVRGLQEKSHIFTSFVIQSGSKEDHLSDEKCLEYFKTSVSFLEEKFGKENLAQATIHFDETTPHLHVIVANLKSQEGTKKYFCSTNRAWGWENLKSKGLIRKAAKEFELDFYKKVSSNFGFEAPTKKLGTKGKQTIKEWKALERNRELENEKVVSDKLNQKMKFEIEKLKEKLDEADYKIHGMRVEHFEKVGELEYNLEKANQKLAEKNGGRGSGRERGDY